jgi:hypothetical protein
LRKHLAIHACCDFAESSDHLDEETVREEDTCGRSQDPLKKMQAQIDARMGSPTAQVVTLEVKRLLADFTRHQDALIRCFNGIDERLLSCCDYIDEYKKTCSVLVGLNERLADMGEEPLELPHVVSDSPGDLILARVERLKLKGKI